jgi:hypothetical protein
VLRPKPTLLRETKMERQVRVLVSFIVALTIASSPLAFAEAIQSPRLQTGDRVGGRSGPANKKAPRASGSASMESSIHPVARVSITTPGLTQREASIAMPTPGPCTPAPPTVSVSPGVGPAVVAGTPVSYTVSVFNNNTAGCPASSFLLALSAPRGVSANLSQATVTAASGASGSAVLTVISPAGAIPGTYRMNISAWSAENPGYRSSVQAKYVVGVVVSTALTVRASTDKSSYIRNQTVVMKAKLLAGASAAPGGTVTFKTTKPDGRSVLGAAVTDSNGVATYNYRSSTKDPAGVYRVNVAAGWNGTSAAGTTSFTAK